MSLTEVVYKIRSDAYLLCAFTDKNPEIKIIINQTSWDDTTQVGKSLITIIGPDAKIAELMKDAPALFDTVEVVRQAKDQTTIKTSAHLERMRKSGSPGAFALEYFGEKAIMAPALVKEGYFNVRLIVTGKVDLAAMLAEYERGVKASRWSDFKLVRIDDFDPEQQIHGAFTENLTQKQLEVIKTALALGFYNTPRDVTLDDLSSIFGISKAAVHNRLQAAERKVIAKFFA
ncbi:MAG TPA: helix-turn-helix domain-containing protein [Candidatus Thermoplasmatota archaeon]|nr:helix-turn-helix domain-containing protein [Candidatus Thermoplasmatota archaeon]